MHQGVLTAALEAGVHTFVFDDRSLAQSWQSLARFRTLQLDGRGGVVDAGTQAEVQAADSLNHSRKQHFIMISIPSCEHAVC